MSIDTLIRLPHGGRGASFPVSDLVVYVRATGRDYIIQGQMHCRLADHRKPHSLDAWLRRQYAHNADATQAVKQVVADLVATGLFRPDRLVCPDSGRRCRALRLIGTEGSAPTLFSDWGP